MMEQNLEIKARIMEAMERAATRVASRIHENPGSFRDGAAYAMHDMIQAISEEFGFDMDEMLDGMEKIHEDRERKDESIR